MTGPMGDIASALPSPILAITDPWLGEHQFSGQLVALGCGRLSPSSPGCGSRGGGKVRRPRHGCHGACEACVRQKPEP